MPTTTTDDPRLIAFSAAHDAFRRDLTRMAGASTPFSLRNPERRQAIMNGWTMFKGQLHIHHNAEDRLIWPRLRARLAGSESALSTLDAMDAEHSLIDPLIAAVDRAFADPDDGTAGDAIDELTTTLSRHMSHEERAAMPLVATALSEQDWQQVLSELHKLVKAIGTLSTSDFVPWLTDGVPEQREKAIATILPAPLRPVYRRVWKPKYDRVNHW